MCGCTNDNSGFSILNLNKKTKNRNNVAKPSLNMEVFINDDNPKLSKEEKLAQLRAKLRLLTGG